MHVSKDSQSPKSVNDFTAFTFTLIAVSALLVVRGALFYFESWDYISFLSDWVAEYRTMSFFEAMGTRVGDYNPPYMYILNIITRIDVYDLFLIKTVSVFFDMLLAFFVMKLVSLRTGRTQLHILAFILTLAVPTVILNSSMWGQCDSIYTSFALGSLYFALRGRSKMAYALIAVALSFKLQAAFLMPIFAVFVFTKKIRLQDCYVFFIVYFAMLLPAFLAGMPIADLLLVYFRQSDSYFFLNLNAVNIWRFVDNVDFGHFRVVGLFTAGTAVLSLLYYTYVNRERLVNYVDFIRLAFLFTVIMPFLLPQMHDRFFYMPDVLSLTVFLFDKRRWYVPVVTVFCSYLAYAYYLMQWTVLFDFRIAAIALLVVILIVLRDFVLSLSADNAPVPGSSEKGTD